MTVERFSETPFTVPESPGAANIVGWAGIVFAVIAAALYCVLFFMLHRLPSTRNDLEQLRTNAPALTRLLVVAASAALLNVVALILCLTGFLAPRRPRAMSVVGTVFSATLLIGVFSVVVVSLWISR